MALFLGVAAGTRVQTKRAALLDDFCDPATPFKPPPTVFPPGTLILPLFFPDETHPSSRNSASMSSRFCPPKSACVTGLPRLLTNLRRNKTFLLCMYFYITLHCIGYSPSIPLSRHQGPTIPYYPPLLGPIPLLRVPSSSYSLSLTASLYDPVPGSNHWNPCTHVHPC